MRARVVMLACGLVVGVVSASLALASPAAAQSPFGGPFETAAGSVNGGQVSTTGAAPTFTGATSNTHGTDSSTITLNSTRTVIDMTHDFRLTVEDTLHIESPNTEWIVVIRVPNVAAIEGTLDAPDANVWFVAPGGVLFGGNASAKVNGLLATTASLPVSSLFDEAGGTGLGTAVFPFSGAPAGSSISIAPGARIGDHHGDGSALAFIAPRVTSGGTLDGEAVYGSASSYALTFAHSHRLLGLDISEGSSDGVGVDLVSGTSADSISVAALSSSVVVGGLRTDGFAANGSGSVAISAGGGLARAGTGRPMQPVRQAGAPARNVALRGVESISEVRATATGRIEIDGQVDAVVGDVVLAAAGDLQLAVSGRVGAGTGTVALSTGSRFVNNRGADAISAGRWIVYAPSPAGQVFGGLDSGNTALWGSAIDSRPPSAVSGNRYVFGSSPTLTFTSLDAQKAYGADASDDLTYSVAGYAEGVSGAFLGDSAATAFSGTPQLSSVGAGSAATVDGSPYPIEVSQGSLTSAAGYAFAFSSTGRLTVTPPDLTPPSVTLTQQPAANAAGWQRSSAIARVVASDESGVDSLACTLDGAAVALENMASDATQRAGDIPVAAEGRHVVACHAVDGASNVGEGNDAVKVDLSAPNAPSIIADRAPEYTGAGDWYRGSATLSFAEAGDPQLADGTDGSGVDPSSVPAAVSRTTSGPLTATGAARDNAGNESDTTSKTVQIDADAPSLSVSCPQTVELNGTATVTIEASDNESGLASDPSATLALDTSTAGEKTVTRTATDNVGNSAQKSCTTAVVSTRQLYTFGGFRQPINPDGSSVFKLGSTVPVKFALTDANGAPIANAVATLQVSKLTANVEGTVIEATSTAAANSGSQFRYDSAQQQYVFNLGTKSLAAGTWRLRATLDDGTSRTVQISLK